MSTRSSRVSSAAIRASLILLAASLPACSSRSTPLEAMPLPATRPRLSAEIRQACPDLPPVTDPSPIGIAAADAAAALDYRRCQAKHRAAVDGFDALAQAFEAVLAGKAAKPAR